MNIEQEILNAFERGKGFGIAEGMKMMRLKELTDEEIIETVKDHFIGAIKVGIVLTNDNVLEFARAILKKAQEK
jgi:hypothetical protein